MTDMESLTRKSYPICFLWLAICISESLQGNSYPIPYALSPVYLEYLEHIETHLYQHLNQERHNNDILQRYTLEYKEKVWEQVSQNAISSSGANVVSNNPILSLQMINRFVKYFQNETFATAAQGLLHPTKLIIPSPKEIEDAMDGLMRLQQIYDLDSNELAEGILDGDATKARLSTLECYELGKYAQESGYYTLALQWYDTALKKLQADIKNGVNSEGKLKPNLILKAMKDTIEEHNQDFKEGMEEGDMYVFSTPIHTTNYSAVAHLTQRKRVAEEFTGKFLDESDPAHYEAIEANMMALCSGQSLKSEKEKAKLFCWLDTERHPYWAINPLKIELLHDSSPPIIQIHDIFSDKWINYLKELSYSELERAPQPPEATPRTAAYAWFEDTEIPKAPISKTVEFITGLNVQGTAAAEALQVAAYAFGGHVEPHYDSRGPDDPEPNSRGDRVTTFLVYLNDVERGGLTAFPMLGFYVKPVKKSAVLWYTNLKNGAIDERTLHAACPVIKGQKWIATKWTHINENVIKRPCGLLPSE